MNVNVAVFVCNVRFIVMIHVIVRGHEIWYR